MPLQIFQRLPSKISLDPLLNRYFIIYVIEYDLPKHVWTQKISSFLKFGKRLETITSVMRQKGESQNGCYKKTKYVKFSEKQTFLTPCYAHARCFFVIPILRFAHLPYCRRLILIQMMF